MGDRKRILAAVVATLLAVCTARIAVGKVDLVTLPRRESVQLTIYNSADLTLVRDRRPLTLKKGENKLQFSWANTLIDPTSLHMTVKKQADKVDIFEMIFPPRVNELGMWRIRSRVSEEVPVEINYFTSGLSWQSFYLATLTEDQSAMKLQGYVRVTNRSGEDYENAHTRLVVGKINLLDQIAQLAKRPQPYGQPGGRPRGGMGQREEMEEKFARARKKMQVADALSAEAGYGGAARPKEIKKEGLSEYFLYTIPGTETIKDGWSKRLPSLNKDSVDVENLYKYEEKRYGPRVIRFLKFKNDKEHNLGEKPLPGGLIKVFRKTNRQGNLAYVGADNSKYIPVDQKVELNLGEARKVKVEPSLMDYRKENLTFDRNGHVSGFDEVKKYVVEVKNQSELPATVEITRNMNTSYWDLNNLQNPGKYEKVDQDTVKYTLELVPHSTQKIEYEVTIYHGDRKYQH